MMQTEKASSNVTSKQAPDLNNVKYFFHMSSS